MPHIKLYEEFDLNDFSTPYFKEVERNEFLEWWISSKENSKYKFNDVEDLRSVTNIVDRICKNICGDGDIHNEIYPSEDGMQNLGLILFTPKSNKTKRLFIRTSYDIGEKSIEFGVIALEFGNDYKSEYIDELQFRVPIIGDFYICQDSEGLEDCLDKLIDKGFLEKPTKEPKPYKQQQILTDEDFQNRNINNEMRSMFYREYGRILKDIPLDLPYEERRTKSLELLDNWFENLQ